METILIIWAVLTFVFIITHYMFLSKNDKVRTPFFVVLGGSAVGAGLIILLVYSIFFDETSVRDVWENPVRR